MLLRLLKPTTGIVVLGSILFGLNSCTDDYFNLENLKEDPFTWTPDLALPLVYSTLSPADIIISVDSTNIYLVSNDNFVSLIYRNVVFSQTINDLFVLPNPIPWSGDGRPLSQSEVDDLNNNGTVQAPFNGSLSLPLPNSSGNTVGQLEFIEFHTGAMMEIHLVGDFIMEGAVTVTYPEFRLNGSPLTHTFNFDNSPGNGIDLTAMIDVSGYRLALNAPTPNDIEAQYLLSLTQTPTGQNATTANSVIITSLVTNASIGMASGDFGQQNLEISPDVVDIDILDNQQDGEITFVDPRLKITMRNSFGMSFQGTINQLRAIGSGSQFINVDYSSVVDASNNFTIPGAPAPGQTDSVVWYFTGTQNVDPGANSNIDVVVNANYQDMVYDLDASTNPGNPPYTNWADRNSTIEVVADVELPFWGTAQNFRIRDTIDFPIADVDEFRDNILDALLRINTLNGFPVDGKLALHFTDDQYNITESVLNNGEQLVSSGLIDGNGRVTTPTNENNDIVLDRSRIDDVFGAKYIIIDAIMSSTNNGQTPIKLYDNYELTVSLGFQVKLSASPSDLNGL